MAMMTFSPITPTRSRTEMWERPRSQSIFFEVVDNSQRMSTVTAFDEDDDFFVDSDDESSIEDVPDSPRGSFDSAGKTSNSSASTLDEAPTPRVSQDDDFRPVHVRRAPSVQGPRGPHLFRISSDSVPEFNFENALQLSPITSSKDLPVNRSQLKTPASTVSTVKPSPLAREVKQQEGVKAWSTVDVSIWLASCGFDEDIIGKFEANDVNGSILMSLQFDDLRALDIASFGKRFDIWNHIAALKHTDGGSPPHTPIQEEGATPVRRARRKVSKKKSPSNNLTSPRAAARLDRDPDDTILPGESISIVAIEQLLPKPHSCSKGENCSKWRKQQRLMAQLEKDDCFPISPARGGHILIAGNPGNADNATRFLENVFKESDPNATLGGISDGPSLVPSSDAMGCGAAPSVLLEEVALDGIESSDPQENVRRFLEFQHLQVMKDVEPQPLSPQISTPGLDMFPPQPVAVNQPLQQPLQQQAQKRAMNLHQLPRLAIPTGNKTISNPVLALSPFRPVPNSPAQGPLRGGTPASEMDVPIYAVERLSPVPRKASKSVPANMQFRPPLRNSLSTVHEDNSHAPPAHQARLAAPPIAYGDATTYAGWMRKRKQKLLRQEWAERHFRLNGTQLAMHATAAVEDHRVLESLDVDHYAVACSSLGSTSKLAAAFKAMRITGGKASSVDDTAFAFQLVPEANKGRVVDYLMDGKKTHHFAVTTRDDRIDWMRELMLAKARKQKMAGYRVTLNGVAA